MIGKTLAHYEITAELGKGGMGEVYRARDGELDREVALKVLPDVFARDSERVARFRREAKLLASLNDPHIAQMYGLHTEGDVPFLAMELVEGEDLQLRLRRGPLPVDEALLIARQIALALEAAHAQGITHRDLKPANIICRPDGGVKVLDFGLAKVTAPDASSAEIDLANSPTVTSQGTLPGMILGTAAYMSPEQARGRPTDGRCDLWAFGAVLMEMLTGRQVFAGDTVTDVLASVIKSEPAWSLLPDDLPQPIVRMLRRCLEKSPARRLHHVADARLEIDDALEGDGEGSNPTAVSASRSRVPWTIAAVAIAVAIGLGIRGLSPSDQPSSLAQQYAFDIEWRGQDSVELSPDGSRMAWIGPERPEHVIHIRNFSGGETATIEDTDIITTGFTWSFDGTAILYFTMDAIARVPVDGGFPEILCSISVSGRSLTQAADGTLLVETRGNDQGGGWYVLRPGSGELEPYERPRAVETGQTRGRPRFLPDGEHFVFAQPLDGVRRAILGRLDSSESVVLFPTDTEVLPTEFGYVYGLRGSLLHRAFGSSNYTDVDEPRVLADQVGLFAPTGYLHAAASRNGTIVYTTDTRPTEAVWFDGSGNELDVLFADDKLQGAVVSPAGDRVVTIVEDFRNGTGDLWSHDLTTSIVTRLTETDFAEFRPRFSPDGRRLAFSADSAGPPNIFVMDARGGDPTELTAPDQTEQYPSDWTPDGRELVYNRLRSDTSWDLQIMEASPGALSKDLVATGAPEGLGRISPDGRWLAYQAYQSGRLNLWVRAFADGGVGDQLTSDGGGIPEWLDDDTLLYLHDDRIWSLDLDFQGDRVLPSRPVEVLASEHDLDGFSLHPDGRILIVRQTVDAYAQWGRVLVGQLQRTD